jgi:CheY-like chemotaxis protein
VQSEIDKGSIFEFSLQLDESSNEKLISHIDDVSIVEKCVENKLVYTPLVGQVLLVEDNKTNQQLIRLYLEKMGASVTCANNGEMAVGLALQHRYDLVYMDMQMPVMPGVDAVKQLRGKGYTVPIVMLTANATAEDRQQCLQAGANDFLTKPIVRQTLYETSARFLSRATHARPDKQPIYSTLLDEEPDLIAILRDYPIYLKRFQQQLAESYHSGDLARFNRFLHDLKGTAGSYGYPQLSQLAVQMETHIKQQEMSKISILIDDLNDMCTRIYQGLEPSMPDTKGAADI